ncbi:MAG: outer membrane porin, OprD family [Sulfurovum sp.]|nr:MAG: outer membrane porin, OprD family [Sulfurovum sp.]
MKLIKFGFIVIATINMIYSAEQASIDGKISHYELGDILHLKDAGKVFGQARTYYVDRTNHWDDGSSNNRSAWAAGGYIGYVTPQYEGFNFTTAVYATYGLRIDELTLENDFITGNGASRYDPSLQGYRGDNYAFIGQAYIGYENKNTKIKVGRIRFDSPLIGSDDARMLPNLFEAAVISNTSIENTTLLAAHITRETVGTFPNVYIWRQTKEQIGTNLAMQSGYGYGSVLGLSGNYVNMGIIALGNEQMTGADNSTAGVTALSYTYDGSENFKFKVWDYIAWDIMNLLYLQADYNYQLNKNTNLFVSAQYINQFDIGNRLDSFGGINSNYGAGKIGFKHEDLTISASYSMTGKSDGFMNGGIASPWGGMPAFTQSMVVRHQFFANTDAWKVATTYNFQNKGTNLKVSVYYAHYDVGAENTFQQNTPWITTESGFDFTYEPQSIKGLQLRFRGNFPNDFSPGMGWNEYRVIANYNF